MRDNSQVAQSGARQPASKPRNPATSTDTVAKDLHVARYFEGFEEGMAIAYGEMVSAGVRLAGCMDIRLASAEGLLALVQKEGLCAHTVRLGDRAELWIYRDPRARIVIDTLNAHHRANVLGMWSMGKLFGYSDADVLGFIDEKVGLAGALPAC